MSNAEGIDVRVEEHEGATVVTPTGDVDLHSSPAMREKLKKAAMTKPARLVVDLSAVPYMDSSGVATLIEAMQIARRQSTALVLCGLQDRVRSMFQIAKLEQVFRIAPNAAEAMKL